MHCTVLRTATALAAIGILAAPTTAAPGGPAEYRITAETKAGLGAGHGGGMAAILGGGGSTRTLALQLASAQRPGTPQAEHRVPPALDLGASVPLLSPERVVAEADGTPGAATPYSPEKSPRLRIYWGCGETPASGAPRVLDAAAIARQRGFGGIDVRFMPELSAATSAGYGEWPNARSMRAVKAGASLVGDHAVLANYAPAMRFALGADRDFLQPLRLTRSKTPGGSMAIGWQGIDRSRAYFLSVVGQAKDGAAVIWTSSAVPVSVFSMMGYLDPAEMARLLAARALLPADARGCTVPASVMREIDTPILQMSALGEEASIAEPRPAAAGPAWRPGWMVRLRYRSDTMLMLGQAVPESDPAAGEAAPAAAGADEARAGGAKPKKRGGLLRGAAGSLLGF